MVLAVLTLCTSASTTGSLSAYFTCLSRTGSCPIGIKKSSTFPCQYRSPTQPPSLPIRRRMMYRHRYRKHNATKVQNPEKLKWHSQSVNWTSEQCFSQQKNSTSNLFQLQSQTKLNELTNSQQLSPHIQTFMLKISKSTIASMQKVPLVFCGRRLSENDLGYKEVY